MRDSIISFTFQFLNHDVLLDEICDTLITLLLTIEAPKTMKQFRPMTLCNFNFKFLNKVLTNCMRKFFRSTLSLVQCGFILGQQLHDNVVIFEEIVFMIHKKFSGKSWMIIKVDMRKAFDRVDWHFIDVICA